MEIDLPFKVKDTVYCIDYMQSEEKRKYYNIVKAKINAIYITVRKEIDISILPETLNEEEWGEDIPLDWVSTNRQELENKILTLIRESNDNRN